MSLPPYSSTLQYLYRADAGTYSNSAGTTPAGDGDTVEYWADQSGGSNYLFSLVGPTLATGQVNGLPALSFNGTSNLLEFSNLFVSIPRTIYAVVNPSLPTSGTAGTIVCGETSSLQWRIDNSSGSILQRLVDANTADIGLASSALSSGYQQINVSWDGNNGVFRQGGASAGSVGPTGSYQAYLATEFLGARDVAGTGLTEYFPGHLAMIAEFRGVHTTTQRQAVEAWIAGIWGV
jgi:hypothetical protein